MKEIGGVVVLAGIAWGLKAYTMDVDVESTRIMGYRIYNLWLADERKTQMMVAAVITISGILLVGFGTVKSSSLEIGEGRKTCCQCAESVKYEAKVCRYCGYTFPVESIESGESEDSSEQPMAPGSWKCPGCTEVHDAEFDTCWKCGANKVG